LKDLTKLRDSGAPFQTIFNAEYNYEISNASDQYELELNFSSGQNSVLVTKIKTCPENENYTKISVNTNGGVSASFSIDRR
jgi:hypothetical protein